MKRALVVDCSTMIDALVVLDNTVSLSQLTEHELHAPHLIDYEFLSALKRLSSSAALPVNLAREALDLWRMLDLKRHPAGSGATRIWDLRHNFSAYDASYVALAEALDAPLLTVDHRMARAASRYCVVVG